MTRFNPIRSAALWALMAAALGAQGCVAVNTANSAVKLAGVATRVVSSTGDVIFDHDGDGR